MVISDYESRPEIMNAKVQVGVRQASLQEAAYISDFKIKFLGNSIEVRITAQCDVEFMLLNRRDLASKQAMRAANLQKGIFPAIFRSDVPAAKRGIRPRFRDRNISAYFHDKAVDSIGDMLYGNVKIDSKIDLVNRFELTNPESLLQSLRAIDSAPSSWTSFYEKGHWKEKDLSELQAIILGMHFDAILLYVNDYLWVYPNLATDFGRDPV